MNRNKVVESFVLKSHQKGMHMELTDEQKKSLELIQAKVKTLSKIEKVKKELLIMTKQKEKLEEKLAMLVDCLSVDASDEKKKKGLLENTKSKKDSNDRHDQSRDNNLLI